MPSELAPIALFAHRRPDHLDRALRALSESTGAADSHLTIFCDGPRGAEDRDAVNEVRSVANRWAEMKRFNRVSVVERPHNLGLSGSVIAGVSEVLAESETIVVLEDDLVVSHDFLSFMNDALVMYQDEEAVISVHGFTMNVDVDLPQTFFIRGADCWGWATWRRGWDIFESDAQDLMNRLEASGRENDFDFDGTFPYHTMLQEQLAGQVDSWAIRWYASAYLADKLTLYPGKSLVRNIGQEGSGTHSVHRRSHAVEAGNVAAPLNRIEPMESDVARQAFARALASDLTPRWRTFLTGRRWFR